MPPVNLLIKPASSSCNMRCGYCFYHDEAKKRSIGSFGLMRHDTMEIIVQKALHYASGGCTFGFQGGEPLLAGLDFFNAAIRLQKQYNLNDLPIHNTVQTNGLLIDDEWAAYFARNNFLVGVSLDGNEALHNLHRKDLTGNGTWARTMRGIEILRNHQVEFNILTVVTNETAKNAKEIYGFYLENGFMYQQYIPCLNPSGGEEGDRDPLTPASFAKFLKDLFDIWYKDMTEGRFVYIRYFENLAGILLGAAPESCDMNGTCSIQYAVEADGSVYPCDFYMLDEFCIGNFTTDSMETIDENRRRIGFIQTSSRLPQRCRECPWLCICRRGCRRYSEQQRSSEGTHCYCEGFREAFPYILPRLQDLLFSLRRSTSGSSMGGNNCI